jgi:hypothetical protein
VGTFLPLAFVAFCAVGFLSIVALTGWRAHRRDRLHERANGEPVRFVAPVRAVVDRATGTSAMKNGLGGVELRVYDTLIVIEGTGAMGRQLRGLGMSVVLTISDTKMSLERSRVPMPGKIRERIELTGPELGREVTVSLDPLGHGPEIWEVLIRAGVTVQGHS